MAARVVPAAPRGQVLESQEPRQVEQAAVAAASSRGGAGAPGQVDITTRDASFISSVTTVYTPTFPVAAPFIASVTSVYTPTLPVQLAAPFIASITTVYAPSLPEVNAPFIASNTHVWTIFSKFDPNLTFGGPGNGGEGFLVELNANGVSDTATLAADISATATLRSLSGDSAFPATTGFVATIDSEVRLPHPDHTGQLQDPATRNEQHHRRHPHRRRNRLLGRQLRPGDHRRSRHRPPVRRQHRQFRHLHLSRLADLLRRQPGVPERRPLPDARLERPWRLRRGGR